MTEPHVIHEDPATRSRWWRYFVAHPLRVFLCAHRGHPERRERRIFEPVDPLSFDVERSRPVAILVAGSDVRVLGERRTCACGLHDALSFRRDLGDEVADHMVTCEECRLDLPCDAGEAIGRLAR